MAEDFKYKIAVNYQTIKEADDALKAFNITLKTAIIGSAEFNQALAGKGAILQWKKDVMSTTQVLPQLTTSAANSGVALQNLNYVIRDSPYFFRDFQLGVMAVGNNMNPLIDSMIRLSKEAKATGLTLSSVLWTALKGPAGVIVAMSLFITILQAVTFAMSKTKSGTKEAKDDIENLRDAVEDLGNSFLEAIEKQKKFDEEMEGTGLRAEIVAMELIKKAGGEYRRVKLPGEGEQRMFFEWSPQQETQLNKLKSQLGDIQKPFADFISKTGQIAKAAEQGVGGLRKLNMSYKDITDSVRGFNKMRDSYDAESGEFAYYNRIIRTIKAYQDSIEKTHKEKKNYLEMEALGYKFISEQDEKLYKKRMDLMDQIRERAIRSGVSPDQAEAFGFAISSKLQGEEVPMWGGGMRKLPEHPFKKFWSGQTIGNNLLKEGTYWAHQFGRELVNAFKSGKFEADKFFSTLLSIIAELSFSRVIEGAFSTLTLGFDKPTADTTNVPNNDSLRKNNVTFVFENVIDGQKIIYKGIKEKQATLR